MKEKEKEIFVDLSKVEKTDRWVLWQIEDRVAQRWSPVFCAPSMESARRQYLEALNKQGATKDELIAHAIYALDGENAFEIKEVI